MKVCNFLILFNFIFKKFYYYNFIIQKGWQLGQKYVPTIILIIVLERILFFRHHQNWVSCKGKHFSIHQMKPDQLGLAKACVLSKIYSVIEK